MRTLVIVGAGQMGKAALLLVNRNHYDVLAFGDNKSDVHTTISNIPVLPVATALSLKPEHILIAVMGKERENELIRQIHSYEYQGAIHTLNEFAASIDIRNATLLRMKERIDSIPGAIAELGVYKGEFAAIMNNLFPDRKLYLFDTFEGFDASDLETEERMKYSKSDKKEFADTSVNLVKERMPYLDQVKIVKGHFPETTIGIEEVFALVSLDADLYEPTLAGLTWFYTRIQPGGVMILHDYNNPRFSGVKKAVEAYEAEQGRIPIVTLPDLHGSAIILKP